MTKYSHKVMFYAGPFDGWLVDCDDPSFLDHYYVPIAGNKYHYYIREGCSYVYQGEVEVVSTG